jgi:hypothetical protein
VEIQLLFIREGLVDMKKRHDMIITDQQLRQTTSDLKSDFKL